MDGHLVCEQCGERVVDAVTLECRICGSFARAERAEASLAKVAGGLAVATDALAAITDRDRSSLRMRDANCARYVAADALDRVDALGLPVGSYFGFSERG